MRIQWSSWIADDKGVIDFARVRQFVSTLLALAGGVTVVAAVILELALKVDLPSGMVLIACGVLVGPLTGGFVADGISGVLASRRIEAGQAKGRRVSDTAAAPEGS
jgi:predicted anti-sigma-YlaC factor YlaD